MNRASRPGHHDRDVGAASHAAGRRRALSGTVTSGAGGADATCACGPGLLRASESSENPRSLPRRSAQVAAWRQLLASGIRQ
jgi:hypothetical protein